MDKEWEEVHNKRTLPEISINLYTKKKKGISEVKQVKLLAKLLFKLFDDSYEFHLLQLFKRMLLSTLCCDSLNLSLTRNSSLRFYFVSLILFLFAKYQVF